MQISVVCVCVCMFYANSDKGPREGMGRRTHIVPFVCHGPGLSHQVSSTQHPLGLLAVCHFMPGTCPGAIWVRTARAQWEVAKYRHSHMSSRAPPLPACLPAWQYKCYLSCVDIDRDLLIVCLPSLWPQRSCVVLIFPPLNVPVAFLPLGPSSKPERTNN